MKFELHSHTKECDKCASISGSELVNYYHNFGYGGMVITDHYFSLFFEWFKDELENSDKRKIIERYLRGYYSARNEGEKIGFTVLCGAEVRFNNCINDYLVYGLEENDFYTLPYLNELKNVKELISVLPDYAIVVQAHPFRDNMTVCNPEALFGIEVYNGGTDPFRNKMAKIYAEHYQKPMTSGSDVHGLTRLAVGGIATDFDIQCSRDLVNILRNGKYALIENNIKEQKI
ncbi:MAG: PHP domain-containing protein [Clostridia bacterium]|nr:PHP domain-containing protein [Clostridia bacterium]